MAAFENLENLSEHQASMISTSLEIMAFKYCFKCGAEFDTFLYLDGNTDSIGTPVIVDIRRLAFYT